MLTDALLAAATTIDWLDRLRAPFELYQLSLWCSTLVGALLGLLGCFVILRRMALIGDAISHAVLPGVVVAFLLGYVGVGGLFVGALAAGIVTAVTIGIVTRLSRVREDAAIGIVFTAMFALGIILISRLPSGTHFDMKCFLFGDPIAIRQADFLSVLVITPLVVGTIVLLFHPLKLLSFDPVLARTMGFNTHILHYVLMVLLSATIVAALRSVGVIMAVAMLITPAAVAYQLTNRLWTMLLTAAITGGFSAFAGMLLAFLTNNPSGPMMVLVATAIFLVVMALAPQRGFVMVWLRRRALRAQILAEDLLKALAQQELYPAGATGLEGLRSLHAAARLEQALAGLRAAGLLSGPAGREQLTEAGRARALELVRAHRLWETYLAEHAVAAEAWHEEAERLEHAPGVAEELAQSLGHPAADPHGSPIPQAGRGR